MKRLILLILIIFHVSILNAENIKKKQTRLNKLVKHQYLSLDLEGGINFNPVVYILGAYGVNANASLSFKYPVKYIRNKLFYYLPIMLVNPLLLICSDKSNIDNSIVDFSIGIEETYFILHGGSLPKNLSLLHFGVDYDRRNVGSGLLLNYVVYLQEDGVYKPKDGISISYGLIQDFNCAIQGHYSKSSVIFYTRNNFG
jgi:hypothetical protein